MAQRPGTDALRVTAEAVPVVLVARCQVVGANGGYGSRASHLGCLAPSGGGRSRSSQRSVNLDHAAVSWRGAHGTCLGKSRRLRYLVRDR
jgi:hypothetical protein